MKTENNRPFSRTEYQSRITNCRHLMLKHKLDLLVVSTPDNMFYLHGYEATWFRANSSTQWSPMSFTIIAAHCDEVIHFDYFDEEFLLNETSILSQIKIYPEEEFNKNLGFLIETLKQKKWLGGVVGFEFDSYLPNRTVSQKIEASFIDNGVQSVVNASFVVKQLRHIKSTTEIKYIKKAVELADIGHNSAQQAMLVGATEREIHAEAIYAMMKKGGDMPAIQQGFKINASSVHGYSGNKSISNGCHAYLDICGVVHHYHGNVSRGYWIGSEPPPEELDRIYAISNTAYDLLQKKAKVGVSVSEVKHSLTEYYIKHKLWETHHFIGGYELGIAFPPDWVGEFIFDLYIDDNSSYFDASTVTTFENILATGLKSGLGACGDILAFNSDTILYTEENTTKLSKIPLILNVI